MELGNDCIYIEEENPIEDGLGKYKNLIKLI